MEFHEMFYQVADFLSKLLEGTTPPPRYRGVSYNFEKLCLLFFSMQLFFRERCVLFRRKAARKKVEIRLAAIDNFINSTLRTPFMTLDLLSVNLVSAEVAKDTVKAVKDLPGRVLGKAFKDPNLPLKALKMKPTRPSLIKVSQQQRNSHGQLCRFSTEAFLPATRPALEGNLLPTKERSSPF